MCKPFSMGRNLFCVHSKKHLSDIPEQRAAKMEVRQRLFVLLPKKIVDNWCVVLGRCYVEGNQQAAKTEVRLRLFTGLARTIYIWCMYSLLGGKVTKYTVIYGVYIRSWARTPGQPCLWYIQ
jgi:hypothetical protein